MNNISVRYANLRDAGRISEIYSYYVEKTAISFEIEPPSEDEFKRRIKHTMMKYPYLVIEEDGIVRGYAYAVEYKNRPAYDWCCETTIYLEHGSAKKGLGKMLYSALEKELKAMGILNLYACIAYPQIEDETLNRNSADFHAHIGYKKIGEFMQCGYKFGRWYDMIWMEKFLGEHIGNQSPVKFKGEKE